MQSATDALWTSAARILVLALRGRRVDQDCGCGGGFDDVEPV
jgi:hypothetical protein